jgi:hypothetical protein
MKTHKFEYSREGILTFAPTYLYVDADTYEEAIPLAYHHFKVIVADQSVSATLYLTCLQEK